MPFAPVLSRCRGVSRFKIRTKTTLSEISQFPRIHQTPVRHDSNNLQDEAEEKSPRDLLDLQTVKNSAKRFTSCRLTHNAHQGSWKTALDEQSPGLDAELLFLVGRGLGRPGGKLLLRWHHVLSDLAKLIRDT
ncbi:hypothetical protein HG530_013438 [Fusarium avenaceum]|nr:hypothetical protein HG530_013438 [Fusarium avenaceum]